MNQQDREVIEAGKTPFSYSESRSLSSEELLEDLPEDLPEELMDEEMRCMQCGERVKDVVCGHRNPCPFCGFPYPVGDCSDLIEN